MLYACTGEQAKHFFIQSGLPLPVLSQIWWVHFTVLIVFKCYSKLAPEIYYFFVFVRIQYHPCIVMAVIISFMLYSTWKKLSFTGVQYSILAIIWCCFKLYAWTTTVGKPVSYLWRSFYCFTFDGNLNYFSVSLSEKWQNVSTNSYSCVIRFLKAEHVIVGIIRFIRTPLFIWIAVSSSSRVDFFQIAESYTIQKRHAGCTIISFSHSSFLTIWMLFWIYLVIQWRWSDIIFDWFQVVSTRPHFPHVSLLVMIVDVSSWVPKNFEILILFLKQSEPVFTFCFA